MVNLNNKPVFVLVHGAWATPFAYATVSQNLKAQGFEVIIPLLPGHGDDNTDPKDLHMQSYVTHIVEGIKQINQKVILVGHSMAGIIVSGVAEAIPNLVEKLIYIAAYVPKSGQSAYALSLQDTQSLLGASLIVSPDQSTFDIVRENITNIFCQDAGEKVQEEILEHYKPEPAAPFSDEVLLTDKNFGSIKKFYVETLNDNGIGNLLQKQMVSDAGIQDVYTLETGHFPMLTQPDKLSTILEEIAVL
ncbi:alpha/beta hydrolase [Mucilaginibacter pallidiroseus]|uniref:Alpha/beta hydrolase n=1 Tax=Mucilaginibacter pallidiroseus TaxID=2599295 RepID=A0A563UE59_9SPHI|nr:alpha/beta hydrolase [Mucilaginibacter pallidiroseus]TWR29641.1 alpha/beta hydrolase [Mucilaginibacter pallidiroseus]